MNSSNLISRFCSEHTTQTIMLACIDKDCTDGQKNRLICRSCLSNGAHSGHFHNPITIQQFEEKTCETQEAIQKLINTIDDHKNNIDSLFCKIINEIIFSYRYSIESLNSIQNSQFNQQIQKIITFNDFEKALNLIMIEPIQEFEDKENKLIKNIKNISGNSYHADELFEKGYHYFESKDYTKALNKFDQALNLDQNHRKSLFLGRSLYFINKQHESIEWFDKALLIDPSCALVLWGKGEVLGLLGQYKESLYWYDKALQVDFVNARKHQEPNVIFQLIPLIGEILRLLGQYEVSLQILNSALEIDSKYILALQSKSAVLKNISLSKYKL